VGECSRLHWGATTQGRWRFAHCSVRWGYWRWW